MNVLFPTAARSINHTRMQDLGAAGTECLRATQSVAIACLTLYITYHTIMVAQHYTSAYLYSAIRSGVSIEGRQTILLLSHLGITLIEWVGMQISFGYIIRLINPIRHSMGYLAFAAIGRE